jgi:hypothetical protein
MDTENEDLELEELDHRTEQAKAIVTLIIVCIANICNVLGFAFDADPWINVCLSVISAASIMYSWWKNQNVTREAIQAQALLNLLKMQRKEAKHVAKAA